MKKILLSILLLVVPVLAMAANECGSNVGLISANDSNFHIHQVLCWDDVNQHTYSPFGLPTLTGAKIAIASGTCPTGTTEDISMDGRMILATTTVHADAGSTGGSATATPAGTISQPIFSGNTQSFTTASNVSLLGIGVALTGPSSTTPAGTVSQPSFSGSSLSTVPPYVKMVFCTIN